jgi:hypothetical protein
MESVRFASAIRRGMGQRIDNLQLLDGGTGPPVGDDDRQRVVMFRTNVNKIDI